MAIIDLQRGIVEAGRIRIGQQVPDPKSRTGTRPVKLETFRLTSSDRRRIEQAAELFGGEVSEWDAPAGKQWQVVTRSSSLDVIVPPSDLSFSQHYELWSAGGCQRRCDGVTEQIGERACVCDPDARKCDIHTRLSVLIRDLPGLGVWRIDTQGWYAARELSGAVQMIQIAAGQGALLPARLRLEQRAVKRPGNNGRPVTQRFAVPVLDLEVTPAQLLAGSAPQPLQLVAGGRPPLTPVPAIAEAAPLSIAEQSAPPPPPAPRKNAAPELPASGRQRRRPPSAEMMEAVAPGADDLDEATVAALFDEGDDGLPPIAAPRPAGAAAEADDEPDERPVAPREDDTPRGRLMRRLHSKDTYGLTHDQVRDVAIALMKPEDPENFSLSDLAEGELQRVDAFLNAVTIDQATQRVCQLAQSKGLVDDDGDPWVSIDPLVVAITGQRPDELTAAQWVAFGLRIAAGDVTQAQQPAVADAGRCPDHDKPWRLSATAKSATCPVAGCNLRASKAWLSTRLLAAG